MAPLFLFVNAGAPQRIQPAVEELVAVARAYEALHVPALFRQWTGPVLDVGRVGSGDHVLDLACGTGVLARAARRRVGGNGFVAGVDLDPGMLAVAGELAPTIDWRLGSAEFIPWPDASFDAVLSQFGMMFFLDVQQALGEMLRVARCRGRIVVAVWDRLENAPAYSIEAAVLLKHAGPKAAEALKAPFALGDPGQVCRSFEEAGIGEIACETLIGKVEFPSIRTQLEADLRGWLPVMDVVLPEPTIRRVIEACERSLGDFELGDGRVAFEMPAHIISGVKP